VLLLVPIYAFDPSWLTTTALVISPYPVISTESDKVNPDKLTWYKVATPSGTATHTNLLSSPERAMALGLVMSIDCVTVPLAISKYCN